MVCLLTNPITVQAAVIPWLYEVTLPVASQTDTERWRAASSALAEVLGRLTGLPAAPANVVVDAALARPEDYYARYRFSSGASNARRDPGAAAASDIRFEVQFDPASVLGLLRRAELPIWSADRPTILIWVVAQGGARPEHGRAEDGGREIVSAASGVLAAALARRARQRGLQITLPLMDIEDWNVQVADVWGRFWEPIEVASARYAPDLLLVGRVMAGREDIWAANWELRWRRDAGGPGRRHNAARAANWGRAGDPGQQFEHWTDSLEKAGEIAVDRVANILARRFAVRGGQLGATAITVRGVGTVSDYGALLAYLQSREYIERVDVASAAPGSLELHLYSRTDRDQLQALLAAGGQLTAAPSRPREAAGPATRPARSESSPGNTLNLIWRGAK